MPRRVSLPGAAELFRTTHAPEERSAPEPQRSPEPTDRQGEGVPDSGRTGDARTGDGPTGDGRRAAEQARPSPAAPNSTTTDPQATAGATADGTSDGTTVAAETTSETAKKAPVRRRSGAVPGSGRVRHDEKITVYVSQDELLALEHARLSLRAEHGMAVDRGRIVREAIAAAIAGLAEEGADSELIRRLSQR